MASTHHHQTRSLQLVQLPQSGHGLMATPMTPILTGIPPCSCGSDCRTCCNFCLLAQTRRCVYTMKRLCSRKSQLPRLPSLMTVYSSIDAIVLCTVTCCTTEELRYHLGPRCFSHKFHTEYAVEACSRITPETSLYALGIPDFAGILACGVLGGVLVVHCFSDVCGLCVQADCGAISTIDGRWRAMKCSSPLSTACRGAGGEWQLATGPRGTCPPGYAWEVPHHAKENMQLQTLLKTNAGPPLEAAWLPVAGKSVCQPGSQMRSHHAAHDCYISANP